MNIPYRTRYALKRGVVIALIIAVVAAAAYLCWFTWLKRYIIYTREQGAVLDMSLSAQVAEGEVAKQPEPLQSVTIYYNEGENAINTGRDLKQMVGYYADTAALESGVDAVLAQALALPSDGTVMLDVKSPKGNFYYSSGVSQHRSKKIDPAQMDDLIRQLDQRGMYLIARLPALRDYQYGLAYDEDGIFVKSGGYLWADDDYCYWLNPTRQGTVTFLVQIATELKDLGFDEVVFDEFRFPDTDNMKFSGDKEEAIASAAQTLVTTCATERFAVSFVGTSAAFPLPEGRSRLYLKDVTAAQAEAVALETGLEDPAVHLVFLTENHDTRFDAYSVLRPLEAAH